ncbi:MAG: metallophosphoesterase [bacterium]
MKISHFLLLVIIISILLPFQNVKAGTGIDISRIKIFSSGCGSADLSWTTSQPSPVWLRYGPTEDLDYTLYDNSRLSLDHYVRLQDLLPETTYYYQIKADEDYFSEVRSFTTLEEPGGKYLFSFAVITDNHYTVPGTFENHEETGQLLALSDSLWLETIKELNAEAVDFVIGKGDFTHQGTEDQFRGFKNKLAELRVPFYPVVGNHDKLGQTWRKEFSELSPTGQSFYSFTWKDWHFIILDSAQDSLESGHIDQPQLSWLISDLELNVGLPTMIFLHHLVNPIPQLSQTNLLDFSYLMVDNANQIRLLLEEYPDVVSVNSGHAHFNHVSLRNNLLYVVTASLIQFPLQYNVYHVYEEGFVQTSHLLSEYITESEDSRKTLVNWVNDNYPQYRPLGGEFVASFVGGALKDRSFKYVKEKEALPSGELKPAILSLYNYPNPVREGMTTIRFQLSGEVFQLPKIRIFDVTGQLVNDKIGNGLIRIDDSPVTYLVPWDCTNSSGQKLASGIYLLFVEVVEGGERIHKTAKAAIIR